MFRLSRHCYNKPHRCPGWAGGGWKYPKTPTCDGGWLNMWGNRPDGSSGRGRTLRSYRCDTCGIRTLPFATRWLDPSWIKWALERRRMRKD